MSTPNGSAPNDLNCSRAAGLTVRIAKLKASSLHTGSGASLLYLIPGVKTPDNGSHWLSCPCCCQTCHSTSNNQHLGTTINISMKCCARRMLYIYSKNNNMQQQLGYLCWWNLSCSSDLTSKKSAKVVSCQDHSLVPTMQTVSQSKHRSPLSSHKEFTLSVPCNVSHGAKGIVTLCNGHSGHLVHGQHGAVLLWQLLHQLRVLCWVDEAHQGGFRLQEVHFTQTWSSNLHGRQMFQKEIKVIRWDAYQPWGPSLNWRLLWHR